jgi:hypothetical protein
MPLGTTYLDVILPRQVKATEPFPCGTEQSIPNPGQLLFKTLLMKWEDPPRNIPCNSGTWCQTTSGLQGSRKQLAALAGTECSLCFRSMVLFL